MRTLTLSLFAALLLTHAYAYAEAPIIQKTNNSGYSYPFVTETCSLTSGSVTIVRRYFFDEQTLSSTEIRPVNVSGDLAAVIALAAEETLTTEPNNMCDGPSSLVKAAAPEHDVILYRTGGCGSERMERQGGATSTLRGLIDAYCPTTH
jgi:hypothetical protein